MNLRRAAGPNCAGVCREADPAREKIDVEEG